MRKIIIKESQIRLLSEDLDNGGVSHNMRETIAVWCLMNDFRYYDETSDKNNDMLRLRFQAQGKTSVCNVSTTARFFAQFIMSADNIIEANDEKEIFGYNDYDDFEEDDDEREEYMEGNKIYRVTKGKESYLIEVDGGLNDMEGNYIMNMFEDGELDTDRYNDTTLELLKWFSINYR